MKYQDDKQLVSLSLQQFVLSVGARTAAPGGGSVSAAVAALVNFFAIFKGWMSDDEAGGGKYLEI